MTNNLLAEVDLLLSQVRNKVSGHEKPFWDEKISKLNSKFWTPDVSNKRKSIDTNSWYKHTFTAPNTKSLDIKKVILKPDKKGYKTIKLRIFPNSDQRDLFKSWANASRWVYNYTVDILKLYFEGKVSDIKVRDFIRNTERLEELVSSEQANLLFIDYITTQKNKFPVPEWMKKLKFHNRAYRGAIKNCVSNWNSACSNKANGNIKHFTLGYRSKKDQNHFLSFEDWCRDTYPTPKILGEFRGWYKKGRVKINSEEFLKVTQHRSATLHWERITNRYFLLLPVSLDFNPIVNGIFKGSDIKTNLMKSIPGENQAWNQKSMIALDPGVRTFQTCYSPEGIYEIGPQARVILLKLLHKVDYLQIQGKSKARLKILLRVRNMVSDLHWKSIKFLCNYRVVFLPIFSTSQMVRKKNISHEVKRILNVFQHYKFQEKLVWKAKQMGVKVHIVNESWTSKTCTSCGEIDYTHNKGEEIFKCPYCAKQIEHDFQGARNIFLKNYNKHY